ncbi:beta-TrCP-like [Daphnia carinata]|uniref:beta-TrCP-like n=1 Tax=Daphnia carinata TaxID=120202 RepID=UPI00257F54F4|nr:beta-TrCP-like [Daphnia carinata]
MEPAQHDFLEMFTSSGVPEIAEHILSYLDCDDLKNAERVRKLWYHVISDGKIWNRCLEKMLHNPTLWNMYRRFDAPLSKPHPMDIQIRDQSFFKMACHTVMRYHQRLLYNWMTGAQQEESHEIYVCGTTVSFDMNSQYLVIGQPDGKILVRMREDVALEPQSHKIQELKLEGSQSGIRCIRLNEENILVCGGAQGVVQIWDVSRGTLVKRFTEKHADSIEHVQFDNRVVITGSSMQEADQGRVTIWDIGNLPQVSLRGEILFPLQKIFGLALDDKHIVVLVGQAPLFEIQIRLRHHSLILVHSMHYRSHAFSGFHCHVGFVAAGSDDGKIRIWDVGTGKCKRILLRPSHDTGPFWLRFNSKFLVTNNSGGISIWNFKEAVNPLLHPCMKLHCCSFRACSSSQSDQWHFQMDAFEIVRFEHQGDAGMLPDLPGRYRGKSFIIRHQFLVQ